MMWDEPRMTDSDILDMLIEKIDVLKSENNCLRGANVIYETACTQQTKELATLSKQLQDTNLLYETYQDLFKETVEENKELSNRLSASESDFYELREEKERLENSRLGWKELAIARGERIDNLVGLNAQLNSDKLNQISKTLHDVEEVNDYVNQLIWKYQGIVATHAKALEEIVTLENEIDEYRQESKAKDKFYESLLAEPKNVIECVDDIAHSHECKGVSYIFSGSNAQQTYLLNKVRYEYGLLRDALVVRNNGANLHFSNGSSIFFRVVSNLEDARNRLSGLQGNNTLIHSSMVKDVELCEYLFSKARNGQGYENKLIVWES